MNLTEKEISALKVLSDQQWHKSSGRSQLPISNSVAASIHRKNLVIRRGTSKTFDTKASGYEYQINEKGKKVLVEVAECNDQDHCHNPECPQAGKCYGECTRNFFKNLEQLPK